MTRARLAYAILISTALIVTGCAQKNDKPKVGNLTQRLALMDNDGRKYGVAEFDPVSGGRIYDTDGKIIGYIVAPTPVAVAPAAVAPAPVAVVPATSAP